MAIDFHPTHQTCCFPSAAFPSSPIFPPWLFFHRHRSRYGLSPEIDRAGSFHFMRVCARVCISECISSLFNFLHHRNCTRGRSIEFYLRINRSSSYVTIGSRKTEKLFSIYSFVHLNELVYTKKQFYPDFKATKGGREWREGDFYGNVILRTSHRISDLI